MEYNKLVIFDLDGVLINSRENHYLALNKALEDIDPKYVITKEEHLSTYDGLPTKSKLEMLHERKGLPREYFDRVWKNKQEHTVELILNNTKKDMKLVGMCKFIKGSGWKLACCSNAIYETTAASLDALGIHDLFDVVWSADLCRRPKPYPEMYWKAMMDCHAVPSTTIIVEDSHIGRQGAEETGAYLLPVQNPLDLTREKVYDKMAEVEKIEKKKVPWRDKELTVLIPMAGAGSRFADAGYTFPKPLIDVEGKTMIQTVVENLNMEANFVFIVQREHYEKYNLQHFLEAIAPGCKIVQVEGVTEGAACTTLLAKNYINNHSPLVIANSDQYVEWNSNECMYAFTTDSIDGGILTFKAKHPKWSYAKTDETGFVSEVAEKKVISDDATVGIYYWRRGKDYVKYAEQMIKNDTRVNGEFYVCPVFNEAIADGKKIRVKNIETMWGLGTPEDLETFLRRKK